MRRKDREMDQDFARDVIDRSQYGVLACVTPGGKPYAIPLSIARDGGRLVFHSATAGSKVDYLPDGQEVALTFVSHVQVPELFSLEELATMANEPGAAARLGSKVFTTEFESACVQGKVYELTESADKLVGLRCICEKFTPDKMAFFELAAENALKITKVYEIRIESLTGKRKRFDAQGNELKRQVEG
ncbi:MAG TPA: pyridoxamine 5'-phosphate oxidase family protein [Anaerolineaceae bacterium]|nr:pyridoxamine 5'-phosphate oxidase family protein [Anaerolineaceae bacterium]